MKTHPLSSAATSSAPKAAFDAIRNPSITLYGMKSQHSVSRSNRGVRKQTAYVWGCTLWIVTNFSASLKISLAKTVTLVVPITHPKLYQHPHFHQYDPEEDSVGIPSPTSSSWTLEILTKIFAAGLSKAILFKIVAPSFVTVISPVEVEWRILFIPFGPRVDLTRSPSARAPTNEERRACLAWRREKGG